MDGKAWYLTLAQSVLSALHEVVHWKLSLVLYVMFRIPFGLLFYDHQLSNDSFLSPFLTYRLCLPYVPRGCVVATSQS